MGYVKSIDLLAQRLAYAHQGDMAVAGAGRAWLSRPFGRGDARRVLLGYIPHRLAETQFHPFFRYARRFAALGYAFRAIPYSELIRNPRTLGADALFLQSPYAPPEGELETLLAQLKASSPALRISYFDWFAPTDLRFATRVDAYVDYYVKKAVMRDRARHLAPTRGHTELTDYFSERFGTANPPLEWTTPATILPKLVLGPSFSTGPALAPLFDADGPPLAGDRPIDMEARMETTGEPWYAAMRQAASAAVTANFPDLRIANEGRVDKHAFMEELGQSKLCFSPFGYGEICWRDFEAIAMGAVLVKPDMGHIDANPDIYQPGRTYIPMRWDLSDLDTQVRAALADPERCRRIATQAFETVRDHLRGPVLGDLLQQLAGPAAQPSARRGLLLVLPLPLYRVAGELYLDAQGCNGLRLWLANFGQVTLAGPLIEADTPPRDTIHLRTALPTPTLAIEPLPRAWTPLAFARALPATRRRLTALIDGAEHLSFAIGGLWGDWAAVAVLIAHARGRKASVWTDRVESEVMRLHAARHSGLRRLYRLANARIAQIVEPYVIRRAALGLFHGMDTYSAYARFSPNPNVVHDVHLGPEDRIGEAALDAKIAAQQQSRPLRLIYAGRAHPDKGVTDWIETAVHLDRAGMKFTATWFGAGPLLEEARAQVARAGIGHSVSFPGPTSDRGALMAAIRDADIFLFCHRTPESPRCLVEALLSGTAIIGYDSAYPADLVAAHGGGAFAPMDPEALAGIVLGLDADRAALQSLTRAAALSGSHLTDEEVFRHRAELIKAL